MTKIYILVFFSLIITACTPRMYIIDSSLGEGRIDKIIYRYSSNGDKYFEQMMNQEIIEIYNLGGRKLIIAELESSKAECSHSKNKSNCIINAYKVIEGTGPFPTRGKENYEINFLIRYDNIKLSFVKFRAEADKLFR